MALGQEGRQVSLTGLTALSTVWPAMAVDLVEGVPLKAAQGDIPDHPAFPCHVPGGMEGLGPLGCNDVYLKLHLHKGQYSRLSTCYIPVLSKAYKGLG